MYTVYSYKIIAIFIYYIQICYIMCVSAGAEILVKYRRVDGFRQRRHHSLITAIATRETRSFSLLLQFT